MIIPTQIEVDEDHVLRMTQSALLPEHRHAYEALTYSSWKDGIDVARPSAHLLKLYRAFRTTAVVVTQQDDSDTPAMDAAWRKYGPLVDSYSMAHMLAAGADLERRLNRVTTEKDTQAAELLMLRQLYLAVRLYFRTEADAEDHETARTVMRDVMWQCTDQQKGAGT